MGIFDSQQERNEQIARDAYEAGRKSDAWDRWSQKNIGESFKSLPGHEKEDGIYVKNFWQGVEDQRRFDKDEPTQTQPLREEQTPNPVEEPSDSSSDDYLLESSSGDSEPAEPVRVSTPVRQETSREKTQREIREKSDAEKKRMQVLADKIKKGNYTSLRLEAICKEHRKRCERAVRAYFRQRGYGEEIVIEALSRYNPPEEVEMVELAKEIEYILSGGENFARTFLNSDDPREAVVANIAMETFREQKKKQLLATIGGTLDGKTPQQLYEFVRANPNDELAVEAVGIIKDKNYLRLIYGYATNCPAGKRAEQRFYELLVEERKSRGFLGNLKHLLLNSPRDDML
jgi:hypothetical protein